jgi:hypothetical protein
MAQDLAGKTDDFLRADAGYWVSMFIAGTLCCDDDTGPRSLESFDLADCCHKARQMALLA